MSIFGQYPEEKISVLCIQITWSRFSSTLLYMNSKLTNKY